MYVCHLRMCDYLYIGVYRYTSVCVHAHGCDMHMGVCTCGGLRLMSAPTLHCSPTLFNKARTFSQIQSSLMWLVLLSSLLWGSQPPPSQAGVTGGLPCLAGNCVCSGDLNLGL